jgi:hypothetical protein
MPAPVSWETRRYIAHHTTPHHWCLTLCHECYACYDAESINNISIYLYIYISISIYLSIYLYIYICIYMQDGFNGKTLSFLFKNFFAEVTVEHSNQVELVPNPEHDQSTWASLIDLHDHTAIKVGAIYLFIYVHCAVLRTVQILFYLYYVNYFRCCMTTSDIK